MLENARNFSAGPDPFGRKWQVQFRWQQTGISIRHSDTIDCKFELVADDGSSMEKVIALPHPSCLAVCKKLGRSLNDAWCMRVAAAHLLSIVETWEDAEKTIVTLSLDQIEDNARKVESALASR